MIFESNLNDYKIIKKRLLIKQKKFIVKKMNRIIEYVKINIVDTKQKMIVRINKFRFSINFEIKKYVWLNRRHIKTIRFSNKFDDKKLNSYKIIKKKNFVYELKLFDDMHIYLIFYFWLLKNFLEIRWKNNITIFQNQLSQTKCLNENSIIYCNFDIIIIVFNIVANDRIEIFIIEFDIMSTITNFKMFKISWMFFTKLIQK